MKVLVRPEKDSLEAIATLLKSYRFLVWDEPQGLVRWMCSWDTRAEQVDSFAADVRASITPRSRGS